MFPSLRHKENPSVGWYAGNIRNIAIKLFFLVLISALCNELIEKGYFGNLLQTFLETNDFWVMMYGAMGSLVLLYLSIHCVITVAIIFPKYDYHALSRSREESKKGTE